MKTVQCTIRRVRFGDDVTELMIEEGATADAESFAYDNMLNGI